jgi:hypothetical protein
VTLAYLVFAAAASAAAPSQAPRCLQGQYHGGQGPEMALRAEREVIAGHAVSRVGRRVVSRNRAIRIQVPIDAPIMAKNCRSIGSRIASQNQGSSGAYSRSNVRSNLTDSWRWKAQGTQYQPHRVWYQPRYAMQVANVNPRRLVAIEAVATKSVELPGARGDASVSPRDSTRDTRAMIKIGLLLGMAYLLFLTLWFWATRLRPRPTRARRGIDTGRRIE